MPFTDKPLTEWRPVARTVVSTRPLPRDPLDAPVVDRGPFDFMPVIGAMAPGLGPDWAKFDLESAGITDFSFRLRREMTSRLKA